MEREYAEQQCQIEQRWEAEIDQDASTALEGPDKVSDGAASESSVDLEGAEPRRSLKATLVSASREAYSRPNDPQWCGSMMIMAHFGYLNVSNQQQFCTHDVYGL